MLQQEEKNKAIGLHLTSHSLLAEARDLMGLLASQLGSMGVKVEAYADASLTWFEMLPLEKQEWVIKNLRFVTEFISEFPVSELEVLEPQLIWRVLQQNKFRYSYDLFKDLPTDSIIEIYDRDGIQLFRSFQFLKFCSYSLEDIYCRPWYDLFTHEAQEESLRLYQDALEGRFRGIRESPFKRDVVREKASKSMLWTEIQPLTFTTFEDSDEKFIGFLACFRPIRHGQSVD